MSDPNDPSMVPPDPFKLRSESSQRKDWGGGSVKFISILDSSFST